MIFCKNVNSRICVRAYVSIRYGVLMSVTPNTCYVDHIYNQNFQGHCMELKGPVEYKSATEIREIFRKASSAKLVPC